MRNVVFMGMGEPLHNEEQVVAALELLTSPAACNFSARHLLVSTVGIPDGMRLARRFPRDRPGLEPAQRAADRAANRSCRSPAGTHSPSCARCWSRPRPFCGGR